MTKSFGLHCRKIIGNGYYAIVLGSGSRFYHRVDGPAIEYDDTSRSRGSKFWYVRAKLHREDGPAYIYYSCDMLIEESYWLDGLNYTKEAFDMEVARRKMTND